MQPDVHIALDPALQLWVLVPITIATLLMGILRQNLMHLARREPKPTLAKLRDANRLKRAERLRLNGGLLEPPQYEARRSYFREVLHKEPSSTGMAPLIKPESLAGQMIVISLNVLPHMALGAWARYIFAGLVVCRLPFSLTPRFRPMLQAGIERAGRNLDVSYVSALSWYVLNLFGNSGLLSVLAGIGSEPVLIPNITSQVYMNVAPDKVFKTEREAVAKHVYRSVVHEAEDRILQIDPSEFAKF